MIKFFRELPTFLSKVLTVLSFIMLCISFVAIIYYLLVIYNVINTITWCVVLCVMIHLNKSL